MQWVKTYSFHDINETYELRKPRIASDHAFDLKKARLRQNNSCFQGYFSAITR